MNRTSPRKSIAIHFFFCNCMYCDLRPRSEIHSHRGPWCPGKVRRVESGREPRLDVTSALGAERASGDDTARWPSLFCAVRGGSRGECEERGSRSGAVQSRRDAARESALAMGRSLFVRVEGEHERAQRRLFAACRVGLPHGIRAAAQQIFAQRITGERAPLGAVCRDCLASAGTEDAPALRQVCNGQDAHLEHACRSGPVSSLHRIANVRVETDGANEVAVRHCVHPLIGSADADKIRSWLFGWLREL